MNFFHMNCRVVSKARGKSSVAASAYVSAEKLLNERTGLTHDFSRKQDVIFSDVVLCENAPSEYKEREKLWNAVEKVEKSADARFARQFDLAIPNEFTKEQAKILFYDIADIFVKDGMCFDGGIHWEEGNHHYDFLVTTRPFKEDGTWGDKDKKEYVFMLDENGNKIIDKDNPNWWEDKKNPERCGIRLPELDENGEQKRDKKGGKIWKRERVDSTGWDKKEMVESWRKNCCDAINNRAREFGYDFNIDHRSYERQNKEIIPSIHEGYMARKMEKEGLVSDRCSINREIKKYNSLLTKIKEKAKAITAAITEKVRELNERFDTILQRRRNNKNDGRNAGRDRGKGQEDRKPDESVGQFIRDINIKEQGYKSVTRDKILKRTDRENERKRLDIEREREASERSRQDEVKNERSYRRSREEGPSL